MAKGKGSSFEREICVLLDKWWTGRDDQSIFWRSSQSGGRATVRSRQNKRTHGSHGDITAVHPCGEPLIDLVTIELKRGYAKARIHDLLDRTDHSRDTHKPKEFEQFIQQAEQSHLDAGSYSWMLIHKRDKQEVMCYFPEHLYEEIRSRRHSYSRRGGPQHFKQRPEPFVFLSCRLKDDVKLRLIGMRLDSFILNVSRQCIEALSKEC